VACLFSDLDEVGDQHPTADVPVEPDADRGIGDLVVAEVSTANGPVDDARRTATSSGDGAAPRWPRCP
jgi:hypothetical protein